MLADNVVTNVNVSGRKEKKNTFTFEMTNLDKFKNQMW